MKLIRVSGTVLNPVKKADADINEWFGNRDVNVSMDVFSDGVEISWPSAGGNKSVARAEEHLKNLQAGIKRAKELQKQ